MKRKSIIDQNPLERALTENEMLQGLYHDYYARSNKLQQLLGKFVPDREGLPFHSASWHLTEEGDPFPYMVWEEKTRPARGMRKSISGYLCPKCLEFDSAEMLKEVVSATGKDFTTWLQDWRCKKCNAIWQYTKVWSD